MNVHQIGAAPYLSIEQNNIYDNLAQTNLGAFYGIRTQQSPCNGLRILYNNVNGAKIDYGVFGSGIHIVESLNCILNCNSMDNTNTGMLFVNNCNNADVRKNQFYYHDIGLAVGHPLFGSGLVNQIGLQTNKENRWYGTDSPIEAFALNQASALASIFEINSSNLNSFFWPLPRKIGAVDDNLVWFVPSIVGPPADENVVACFITYPGPEFESELAATDYALLYSAYQPQINYPAMTWEAKWEFADRLNRNPALQTLIIDVTQYYQNTYGDTYSSLNRAYQAYLNRWQPNDPLATQVGTQATALADALEQRWALDGQLSEHIADNASLHAQMLDADSVLHSLSALLKSSVESLNTLVGQQVNAVISDVESIVCTEDYETDMKDVVKTLLLSHASEGALTSEQTSRMTEIAAKCRYSGGYAVLLARGFFAPQESYSQDGQCEAEERSSQTDQDLNTEVLLFPNPADQLVRIQVTDNFESGTFRVFSAQGRLLQKFALQSQSTTLPVGNLANGIYFLDVQVDGKPTVRKSFVINR